jgi:hypothetical protein
MKENRTPNYGLDAPVAVRNMLIVAALGIISLITRLLGVWSRQDVIAVIARPLMLAGLSCGAMALWMIYDSKIGKIRERDTISTRSTGTDTSACWMWGAGWDCFSSARPNGSRPAAPSASTNGSRKISAATTQRARYATR